MHSTRSKLSPNYPQATEGCKNRDHKVKVRNPKDSEMYLTLMTHRCANLDTKPSNHHPPHGHPLTPRDLICLSPKRAASVLRVPGEGSSVSLPSPRGESVSTGG